MVDIWLFFVWSLLSDLYEHVRDEVKRKCDVIIFGIRRDCNWLDLDKVSLKYKPPQTVTQKTLR